MVQFHHFGPSPAFLPSLRPPMDDPTFFINPFSLSSSFYVNYVIYYADYAPLCFGGAESIVQAQRLWILGHDPSYLECGST